MSLRSWIDRLVQRKVPAFVSAGFQVRILTPHHLTTSGKDTKSKNTRLSSTPAWKTSSCIRLPQRNI